MKESAADPPSPLELTIQKPLYGGDFLARFPAPSGKPNESTAKPEKAVFVPLTLPGERIKAQIKEEKRNFSKAEITEILSASTNRVEPRCRHFGVCGGCQYQHADFETQLVIKEQVLRETLSRAGVVVPVNIPKLTNEPWEYRNRIRLALVEGSSGLEMGYRGRRSHAIVPIKQCPIAPAGLLEAAEVVRKYISERRGLALISEIELFTNEDGSGLLVTLFLDGVTEPTDPQAWLQDLLAQLPDGTGLRLQAVDGRLNARMIAAAGASGLRYSVAETKYSVDHGAFFQVNRNLVAGLLDLVTAGRSGKRAWDLFAGVGLFARRLAASFESVIAVESAPASSAALKQNLAGTAGQAMEATALEFLSRNRAEREPGPDLIVLDPPRAGLGDEVTSLLNAVGAPRLVYVSCDPSTLARDLKALTVERYRIEKVTLVDMFPQTFHIESVVELSRAE